MLPHLALCPGPATVYMMRQPFYISLYMRLKLQKIEETVYIVGGNIKCATDDKKYKCYYSDKACIDGDFPGFWAQLQLVVPAFKD